MHMKWRSALNPVIWLQHQLEAIEICDPQTAHTICKLIPDRCPFERQFVWGYLLIQIPALCKLNPFYRQFLALRLKAVDYLANQSD